MKQPIVVTGSDFTSDLSLELEPPLEAGVDYTLQVASSTRAVLNLLPGKMWRSEPGCLYVLKGKKVESTESANDKVCVATVLPDPVFVSSVHETTPALVRRRLATIPTYLSDDANAMFFTLAVVFVLFVATSFIMSCLYTNKRSACHCESTQLVAVECVV